jgi:hypothetical protein
MKEGRNDGRMDGRMEVGTEGRKGRKGRKAYDGRKDGRKDLTPTAHSQPRIESGLLGTSKE